MHGRGGDPKRPSFFRRAFKSFSNVLNQSLNSNASFLFEKKNNFPLHVTRHEQLDELNPLISKWVMVCTSRSPHRLSRRKSCEGLVHKRCHLKAQRASSVFGKGYYHHKVGVFSNCPNATPTMLLLQRSPPPKTLKKFRTSINKWTIQKVFAKGEKLF